MKYGGGFPLDDRSCIPRWSSASSAASPGGLAPPPPDCGSTRTTRGGAEGAPGAPLAPGVAGDGLPPAQAKPPSASVTAASAVLTDGRDGRTAFETGTGSDPPIAYRRFEARNAVTEMPRSGAPLVLG